jgi:uncharacterized repeat protein (TIGR01451 family)
VRGERRITGVFLLIASVLLGSGTARLAAQEERPRRSSRFEGVVVPSSRATVGTWPTDVIATSSPLDLSSPPGPQRPGPLATGFTPLGSGQPLPLPPETRPVRAEAEPAVAAGTGKGRQVVGVVVEKLAPEAVPAGQPLVYDIVVRNGGPGPVQGVRVEEHLPAGTRVLGAEPRAELHGTVLVWDLGGLGAGVEKKLKVEVQPAAEGPFTTTAVLTCATRCELHTHVSGPGLSLTMTGPQTARVGEEVIFQLQLTNNSSRPLRGILLRDRLPAGLAHPAGEYIEAEIASLAPREVTTIPLKVTATQPGPQVNVASVWAAGVGEVAAEARLEVRERAPLVQGPLPASAELRRTSATPPLPRGAGTPTIVPPVTDFNLKIPGTDASRGPAGRPSAHAGAEEQEAPPEVAMPAVTLDVIARDLALEVGGETIYEVRVLNQGLGVGHDVQVAVELPEGLALVGSSGPTRWEVHGRQVVFERLERLGARARAAYQVRVRGHRPGDWRVKVYLRCGSMARPVCQEVVAQVDSDQAQQQQINNR